MVGIRTEGMGECCMKMTFPEPANEFDTLKCPVCGKTIVFVLRNWQVVDFRTDFGDEDEQDFPLPHGPWDEDWVDGEENGG